MCRHTEKSQEVPKNLYFYWFFPERKHVEGRALYLTNPWRCLCHVSGQIPDFPPREIMAGQTYPRLYLPISEGDNRQPLMNDVAIPRFPQQKILS